jgi:hypothetical protein
MSFFFQKNKPFLTLNHFLILLGMFFISIYTVVQYLILPIIYKDFWYIYPSSINPFKLDYESQSLSIKSKEIQEWKIKKYSLTSRENLDISFKYSMDTLNDVDWFFMKKNIVLNKSSQGEVFSFVDGGNIHRMYRIPENVKKIFIFTDIKIKGKSRDCNGIFILNASKSSCLPIFNSENLQQTTSFQIEDDPVITLGFTGFIDSIISVSKISIFYFDPLSGAKKNIPIMRPEKVSFSVNSPNGEISQIFYLPISDQMSSFRTSLKSLNQKIISVIFTVAPNTNILVRDFTIYQNKYLIRPVLFSSVFELPMFIFFNKNIAGHSLVAIGLLCLLLAKRLSWFILPVFITGIAVYLTGSRTALIVFIIGLIWKLWFIKLKKQFLMLFFFFTIFSLGLFVWLHPGYFSRLGSFEQSDISRQSIWHVALNQIYQHPFGGTTENFADIYLRFYPENKLNQVNHAHNFWLQIGVRFGVFGLVGSFVLTLGILWIAWNFGSWQGLSFVMPFIIMNFFDYSLDYSGVWIPLVIGLWYLKKYEIREIVIKLAS